MADMALLIIAAAAGWFFLISLPILWFTQHRKRLDGWLRVAVLPGMAFLAMIVVGVVVGITASAFGYLAEFLFAVSSLWRGR